MRDTITVSTPKREVLVDITTQVQRVVDSSGVRDGLVAVYVQGATAAIMIQENWDDSVQTDVVNLLAKLIPRGVWLHDAQDGNGDSHLKAGIVGPSETVPVHLHHQATPGTTLMSLDASMDCVQRSRRPDCCREGPG